VSARFFSLADGLAQREDNFLLLRFLAAALVIYGHAYAIMVEKGPPELFIALGWPTYSGAIAVDLFFATSGFLVTGSFLRRRNVLVFLWARALRLLPAYAACVVLSAFVLGALYTQLPVHDYLHHPDTRAYPWMNLQFGVDLRWELPGVFTDNPRRATVNGSLWTLPAEVRMYLWVAILGMLGILTRRAYATFMIVALLIAGYFVPDGIPLVPFEGFVHICAMFAFGALAYVWRDRIPVHGGIAVVLALACWLSNGTRMQPPLFALAELAFTFWFAYRLRWHGFNRVGDYSYGMYLWGFPCQQIVAHHLPGIAPLANAALSLPLAIALGIVSWRVIEKPALSLKSVPRALWEQHLLRRAQTPPDTALRQTD
jgi:peptidoglycan/LPS O-acetylase OafA/YrhL